MMKMYYRGFIRATWLLIAIFTACLSNPGYAESVKGGLALEVSGFESNAGMAMIALCSSEAQYNDDGNAFIETSLMINEGRATWHVAKLPDGEYAIKLYHDENNNGKLDTNFFGVPNEAVGFSNNAQPGLGMPAYKKVKFIIQGAVVRQVIKVARM
jgi:uncharacterized protein (DUF2141 family)